MKMSWIHPVFIAMRWLFLLALILSLGLSWSLLRNEKSRLSLAERIIKKVNEGEMPIFKVEGPGWPTLHTVTASEVRIFDQHGDWLIASNLQASVGLRALMRKILVLPSASASFAEMSRVPEYASTDRQHLPEPGWRIIAHALSIEHLSLATNVMTIPLAGQIKGTLNLQVHGDSSATLSGESLYLIGETLSLEANVLWNAHRVAATNMIVTTQGGVITGHGQYIYIDRAATVHATTEQLEVEPFATRHAFPVSGIVRGEADVTYTQRTTEIFWDLKSTNARYDSVFVPSLLSEGSYVFSNRTQQLKPTILHADTVLIGSNKVEAFKARVYSRSNNYVAALSANVHSPVVATTVINLEAHKSNDAYRIIINNFDGTAAGHAYQQTGPSEIRVRGNHWSAFINQLQWQGASARATFSYDGTLATHGFIRNVNLALLPSIRDSGYHGKLDTTWHINGFPHNPEGMISLRVNDLASSRANLTNVIPQSLRGSIRVNQNDFRVDAQTHGATNASVLVQAVVPYIWTTNAPWLSLNANRSGYALLQAQVQLLPFVKPLLPEWQLAKGLLHATLTVSGTRAHPNFSGQIVITNGFFEDIIHGTVVRDITIRANADSTKDFELYAEASDDHKGNVRLSGTYRRDHEENFVLHSEAVISNFIAGQLFNTELPVNGRLMLNGTGTTARLFGEVQAPAITLRLPRQLPPALRSMSVRDARTRHNGAAASAASRNFPYTIKTDINISATQGVRVEGKQLRTEWQGRGHITGTLPDQRFGGRINLVRGSFMFLGRRFTIVQGEIIVPSVGRSVSPVVFITAGTRAGGADITLNIEGSSDEPTLTLSSSPPLEKNEIVARLLFGKSGDAVSPFQLAYLAYALDLLEGGGPLLQQLDKGEQILGLDQVDIVQSEEETGLSAVTFGKRVNDRFYVEGEVGLQDNADVLAVEAEITRNLILRTETSPRIREGISINWRKDY